MADAQKQVNCLVSGAIRENGLRVGITPLSVTSRLVSLTIFLSFYSQRVQKPLQGALSVVVCTNLRLIDLVILV